jgi:sulfur carrier protein ThiS
MPRIAFTGHLRRYLDVSTAEVSGATVGEALDRAFRANPRLRGYVLDDQGALRRHVSVYVAGRPVLDRQRLSDPVSGTDDIYVLQALSGG